MPYDPHLLSFFHQRGYEAPSTPRTSFLEDPALEIGELQIDGGFEWETSPPPLPASLTLRVRLEGILRTAPSPTVQAIVEGEALHPATLYAPRASDPPWEKDSHYTAVRLLYAGQAFYHDSIGRHPVELGEGTTWGLALHAGDCLYIKPFATETQNVTEQTLRTEEGLLKRTPPDTTQRLFRPYGGFWDKKKHTACPVYYEIRERYPQQTTVSLHFGAELPPYDRLIFPPPREEEDLSLEEAVRQGYVNLTLFAPHPVPYSSSGYALTADHQLEIMLTPALPQKRSTP